MFGTRKVTCRMLDWNVLLFSDEKHSLLDDLGGLHSYWDNLQKHPEVKERRQIREGALRFEVRFPTIVRRVWSKCVAVKLLKPTLC